MHLGMVGLGRMGGNMICRLLRSGHERIVFDSNAAGVRSLVDEGATGCDSLDDPVLSAALDQRFTSRGEGDFAGRILSAMRDQFGGHVEQDELASSRS